MAVIDGKRRITVTVGVLIATVSGLYLAGVGLHGFLASHLRVHFVSSAAAQTRDQQIKDATDATKELAQAVQRTANALTDHVTREELKDARARIDSLRADLAATQLWEAANSENEISRARKLELVRQIERAIAYVGCLEQQRSLCEP